MTIWNIDLWENENGTCYVEKDILATLKKKDPFVLESLGDRMGRYTSSSLENAQKLKYLKKVKSQENLWELVFSLRKTEIRFLGPLVLENSEITFYALTGFKKKEQEIKQKYIQTTKERFEEFKIKSIKNELQKLL